MTRRFIRAEAEAQAKSYLKVATQVDALTLDSYIEEIMFEMCQASQGVYKTVQTALVAGQATYCASSLFKINETDVRLENNDADDVAQWIPISMTTASKAYGAWPYMLDAPQPQPAATPTTAVFQGLNKVLLYPTPTYSWDVGLKFRGYGFYVTEDWPTDDSECPLPMQYHGTVRDGVTARIMTYNGNQAGYLMFRSLYDRGKGRYVAQAGTLTENAASRVEDGGGFGYGGGPLNNGPGGWY